MDNPKDSHTKILVFILIATGYAHTYKNEEESAYYVRIGKETKQARNGTLNQLLVKRNQKKAFDQSPCISTSLVDIDTFLFRNSLEEMGLFSVNKPFESYLSDTEQVYALMPPLCIRHELNQSLCLKKFYGFDVC